MIHLRHGYDLICEGLFSFPISSSMGCLWSNERIDFNFIQPVVLRIKAGLASYSGTTERGQCQVCFIPFFIS